MRAPFDSSGFTGNAADMPRGQNFYFKVYNVVRRIPVGRVATYGQVAALAGSPRSARIVGWALRNQSKGKLPWHRVLNKDGMISIENMAAPKEEQARLLTSEGVEVVPRDGNLWVDLKRFGWEATL